MARPNINIFIFLKTNARSDNILEIGRIFYKIAEKYKKHFSVKIDAFPYRLGQRIGHKTLELVLSPHIVFMSEKDANPPFGIPSNVLDAMRSTRKVVFGSDPLRRMNLNYTKQDILQWAFFDICYLFKKMIVHTPLSYNITKNNDLLTEEILSFGKNALIWGVQLFLSEKDLNLKKHYGIIQDKSKLVDFFIKKDSELGKCAKVIIDARSNFLEYKKSKRKTFALYDSTYRAVCKVSNIILSQLGK